jgi:hypothetical protein
MAKQDTLQQAREEYADAQEAVREQHERFRADLRFSNPAEPEQWDDYAKVARKGRPMLTLDRTNQYIAQVVNDSRQNKPSIQTLPADSRADIEVAKRLNGIIRHIEYTSRAAIAYDTAIELSARVGQGWLRVLPKVVRSETNEQEITIARVHDPMSICLDPNSVEPDGCDSMFGFAESTLTDKAFSRMYPKAKKASWDSEGWFGDDSIRIAEQFRIYEEKQNRITIRGPEGNQMSVSEDDYWKIAAQTGMKPEVLGTFIAKTRKVKWRKLSGVEVLEETEFPSQWVPLIPVLGYELWVEGKRYLCGMVRRMMDGQRLHNYEASAQTEALMVQPKAPFLVSTRALEGNEKEWQSLNSGNPPYLPWNDLDTDNPNAPPVQPPQRLSPPSFPAAFNNGNTRGSMEMEASVGMSKSNLGQPSNAVSGRAKLADQREGDTANFHYIDNLRRSMEHMGRIIVDMIPKIYDTERQAKIMGEDGEQSAVQINPNMPNPVAKQGGKIVAINPGVGAYDVRVKVGPSFASLREETAANLTELSRGNPQLGAALAPLLVKMSDLPEADKISRVAIAMLPPNVQQVYNEDDSDSEIPAGVKAKMMADAQQIEQMSAAMDQAGQVIQDLQGQVNEKNTQVQDEAAKATAEIKAAQTELKAQADALASQKRELDLQKRNAQLELDLSVMRAQEKLRVAAEPPEMPETDSEAEAPEPEDDKEDKMLAALSEAVMSIATQVQQVSAQVEQIGQQVEGAKTVGAEKIKGQDGKMIGARITQADGTTRDVLIQ